MNIKQCIENVSISFGVLYTNNPFIFPLESSSLNLELFRQLDIEFHMVYA